MVFIVETNNYDLLVDYLTSINTILNLNFIKYKGGQVVTIPKDTKFIILVYQIPQIDFSQLNDKITVYFLNTEQLTRYGFRDIIRNMILNFYSNYYMYLTNKPILLDFSKGDIDFFLEDKSHDIQTIYLPYLPYKSEINYIRNLIESTPKEFDIGFIGSSSIKRMHMLHLMRLAGFSVYRIEEKWGEERDRELAKCRILLNVHCDDDFKVFECIRCDRWIFGGMKVLSETSLEKPYDNPFLRVDDYINLVTRAQEYIGCEVLFQIDTKTIEEKELKVIEFKNLIDSL